MIVKPVWCGNCKRHSWTRRQLLAAWERDKTLTCPEPDCGHQVLPGVVKAALQKEGILDLEEEDPGNY